MNAGALVEDLARCIEDEIAALDAGNHEALALATGAKLAALEAVRRAPPEPPPTRALLAHVIELNAAAAKRVNRARARIERRLGALARAAGQPAACAYGADGRPVTRFLEDPSIFIRLRPTIAIPGPTGFAAQGTTEER